MLVALMKHLQMTTRSPTSNRKASRIATHTSLIFFFFFSDQKLLVGLVVLV
jgi:hypothetical protein